jgi:hypothetical protein
LKIVGSKLPNGLYGVDAILICPSLNVNEHVNLVVDTGSVNTLINDVDMVVLGIDYNQLEPEKERRVIGIEASAYIEGEKQKLDTFKLPPYKLRFRDEESGKSISEDIEDGLALRHNEIIDKIKDSETLREQIKPYISSILGINILRSYRIHFTDLGVYLEI